MITIQNITFGAIKNVRKSGDEDGVYFVDVEISPDDGFPMEPCLYCARADDAALTGKWVYQQIIDGNFEGEVRQLEPRQNPITLEVMPDQPVVTGAQNL